MADRFPSISARSGDVNNALCDLKARAEETGNRHLENDLSDVIDRFHLWAGNLGVCHHPSERLSLDSRVSESPDIRDLILKRLDDLEQASAERKICSPQAFYLLIIFSIVSTTLVAEASLNSQDGESTTQAPGHLTIHPPASADVSGADFPIPDVGSFGVRSTMEGFLLLVGRGIAIGIPSSALPEDHECPKFGICDKILIIARGMRKDSRDDART